MGLIASYCTDQRSLLLTVLLTIIFLYQILGHFLTQSSNSLCFSDSLIVNSSFFAKVMFEQYKNTSFHQKCVIKCFIAQLMFFSPSLSINFSSAKTLVDPNGLCTGKSLSEALIFVSTNPQYDDRLFIDLPILYMKTTISEHVVYKNKQKQKNNLCTKHVLSLYFSCSELVNQ